MHISSKIFNGSTILSSRTFTLRISHSLALTTLLLRFKYLLKETIFLQSRRIETQSKGGGLNYYYSSYDLDMAIKNENNHKVAFAPPL